MKERRWGGRGEGGEISATLISIVTDRNDEIGDSKLVKWIMVIKEYKGREERREAAGEEGEGEGKVDGKTELEGKKE